MRVKRRRVLIVVFDRIIPGYVDRAVAGRHTMTIEIEEIVFDEEGVFGTKRD
jgi:hypothetical protein